MGVYDGLVSGGVSAIERFGFDITLFSEPTTPLDAAKPWRGSSRDESTWPKRTVKAVEDQFEAKEIDGDRIKVTDAMYLVAGDDPNLAGYTVADTTGVDINGVRFGALLVETVKPGAVIVMYVFRVRKQ